jgi:hypothetical protein
MCYIQFQFILIFSDLPDGIFQSKFEKEMALKYLHVTDLSE